jgi:MFS family permease
MPPAREITGDIGARAPWLKLTLTVMPAAFLMNIDKQVIVILAPMIQKEFDLDLVTITQILAVGAWSYAMFQIPGAWLAARLGPLLTIGLCVSGWSFAVLITPFAIGPMSLMFLRASMGALQAPDWLSSVMILEREVPLRLRSRGSAALLGAAYFGAIVSGPLTAVIASQWGWRACFQVFGICGVFFGISLLLFAVTNLPRPQATLTSRDWSGLRLIETMKQPRIHALATAYLLFSGVQSFVYVMLPIYLAHDRHISLIETGWLSSAPFVALYLAVLTGGILSDAILKRTKSLFVARVPVGGIAMIGSGTCFAIGMSMNGLTTMMLFTCAGMAFVGIGQVVLWSAVQDTTSGAGGFPTAWVQVLGGVGLGLAPLIAANMVAASGDWGMVRFLLLASGIGAAACLWLVQPHRPFITVRTASAD